MEKPLLSARNLRRTAGGRELWRGVSFDAFPGEIWFIRGPSGVGKTLLLRALAYLDELEAGSLQLQGRSPSEVGIPSWRAQVMYVHQSRINYKGSPSDFFEQVCQFCSQRGRPHGDLGALVQQLGLEPGVLQQPWSELSGGQAQRVSLAIAVALRPKVLLLDEPTSACDTAAALKVEALLRGCQASVLWVTHDPLQVARTGGRVLELPSGAISSIVPLPFDPETGVVDAAASAGGSGSGSQHGAATPHSSHGSLLAVSRGEGEAGLVC